ncbi:hypothetical protein POM88_013263 [Heracleum sosnowskyi]|uniref:Uncharacterized protein n=1 Tax=Heracleum sosnowskyi TaxID=360622 RepID=A0AAD8IY10_9APIA|nr:hypothetical protein POM88_013263 [Heracleum sosnowskyi]
MGFSSWLYTNSTKQVLKIVHPGGHAELHDRPVLAAEIINRNPRCCVAQPNIFQQPWAIVSPETTLMPGQKFYVVPVSTIRRLQKLSLKYNTSQNQDANQNNQGFIANVEGDSFRTTCWQSKHSNSSNGVTSNDSYCACLRSGKKIKGNNEESSKERLASNLTYSEKGSNDISIRGPPKKLIALDNWHPGLESIGEEIASA